MLFTAAITIPPQLATGGIVIGRINRICDHTRLYYRPLHDRDVPLIHYTAYGKYPATIETVGLRSVLDYSFFTLFWDARVFSAI